MPGTAASGYTSPTMWQRRWVRRLVIAAGITPIVVALLGFLVAPPIVRRVAQKQLTELLGRRVGLGARVG